MKLVLFCLLLSLVRLDTVIFTSNPTTVQVTNLYSTQTINDPDHTKNQPNFLGNGAQWVKFTTPPVISKIVFYSKIHSDCPLAPTTLTIAAQNTYTVFLNDAQIATGKDWQQKQTITVKLNCGYNNLTVAVAQQKLVSSSAVYSLSQDQTNCYKCDPAFGFYSRKTCQCRCYTQCRCKLRSGKKWAEYPKCRCQCPGVKPVCNELTQFFDERKCSCACKIRFCASNYYQDRTTCNCVKRLKLKKV